jgi:hypothetical protein
MPRPKRKTVPTGADLERRVLEVLRAAGGEIRRGPLREAIDMGFPAAELDRATEALLSRGLIRLAQVRIEWQTLQGYQNNRLVTVYRLAKKNGRKS